MPKVFVVQETKHNIDPAYDYGNILVLLLHSDLEKGTDWMLKTLRKHLADATSSDYILCVGDPLAIGLALHIALEVTKGKINVLSWDKRHYRYDEQTIRT